MQVELPREHHIFPGNYTLTYLILPNKMKALTLQQAFNTIYKRFVIDKKPFGIPPEGVGCLYSDKSGKTRCSIGCLVTKETAIKMENYKRGVIDNFFPLSKSKKTYPELSEKFAKIDREILTELQNIHDDNAEFNKRDDFKKSMIDFARKHKLTIPKKK